VGIQLGHVIEMKRLQKEAADASGLAVVELADSGGLTTSTTLIPDGNNYPDLLVSK
jgi:hypothetical protein